MSELRRGNYKRLGPASSVILDRGVALALLPIALSAIVYFRITGNYFFQDDFLHLYRIVNVDLVEFLLTPHGGHNLVARNAVFALFHALFGTAATWYFAVVLLTHLLNVYLLFAVIRSFSGSAALGCFGAALWGTCRLNEGALGWYSVYGHVLVGTGLLWVLHRLARIAAGAPVPRWAWVRWLVLLAVTATCFGVGLGVAMVSPLLAWLLLPPSREKTATVRALCLGAVAIPFLYLGCQWLYAHLYAGQSYVPFLLNAFKNLDLVAAFTAALVLSGTSGLCLGGFAPSRPFLYPTALYVAVPLLLALAVALARSAPAVRARLIACLVAVLACYGAVALGRALFLLRVTHAAAADEPRFHYAALIPLTLLLCELVRGVTVRLRAAEAPLLLVAALATPWLAASHRRAPLYPPAPARQEVKHLLAHIHALAAAQPGDGSACIGNGSFNSIGPMLLRVRAHFPGWAATYAIFEPSNEIDGRRLFFVESDLNVVAAAARGRRSADLIVPPRRRRAVGCLVPLMKHPTKARPPP